MGKLENKAIFEDSMDLCLTSRKLNQSIILSMSKMEFIPESSAVTPNLNRFEDDASVIVSNKRTLQAASYYKTGRTAVLNFASATNPGGGVTKGSSAQEEALCRISTLYKILDTKSAMNSFYKPHRESKNPIHNADIIYIPNITVFKSDSSSPELLPENEWYFVDVISCAAPNLRRVPSNPYNTGDGILPANLTDIELYTIHVQRLTKVLEVASAHEVDNIILGAWGCGAFENKPDVVARAARDTIQKFSHAFKTIEFAVFDKANGTNYNTFNRVIKPTNH